MLNTQVTQARGTTNMLCQMQSLAMVNLSLLSGTGRQVQKGLVTLVSLQFNSMAGSIS